MKSKLCILALAAMAAFATPVFADVVDDAIVLAQSGVSPDVIVAWSQHQHMGPLSAQDILRLKNAKVPDQAIAAMIQASQAMAPSVNAGYVDTTPSTTYYYNDYPTYYTDDYPYYYSDGYPYYYGGYPYYGYGWGPSFGLNFGFGGGHDHGFRSGSGFRSGTGFTSGGRTFSGSGRSFSSGGTRSFSGGTRSGGFAHGGGGGGRHR
ncbi:MAG TPA: hypothetical protein VKX17_28325 [Planctomycetota bacterium]|nr:hypothetical protein [Planctomycetota bacterium]